MLGSPKMVCYLTVFVKRGLANQGTKELSLNKCHRLTSATCWESHSWLNPHAGFVKLHATFKEAAQQLSDMSGPMDRNITARYTRTAIKPGLAFRCTLLQ
jgi:hypothetical protein